MPDALPRYRRRTFDNGTTLREGGVYEPFLAAQAWQDRRLSLLSTQGTVKVHDDCHLSPVQRYIHFLVLVNDGFMGRGPQQKPNRRELPVQTPGSIVVLDLYQKHHCVRDRRLPLGSLDYPTWAALLVSSGHALDDDKCLEYWAKLLEIPQSQCRI